MPRARGSVLSVTLARHLSKLGRSSSQHLGIAHQFGKYLDAFGAVGALGPKATQKLMALGGGPGGFSQLRSLQSASQNF